MRSGMIPKRIHQTESGERPPSPGLAKGPPLSLRIRSGKPYSAVLGSHRGRGVGSALLRRAFATFTDRGLRRVRLNVDAENVTGATAVYERVGMRVVNRWDLWERQG